MGVFEMVVAIVFIATAGKVMAARLRGRSGPAGAGAGGERIRALEAALYAQETRLSLAEAQVGELGEKLEFMENLLAKPRPAPELAAPERQAGRPAPG
jgi:hypothetical protein